MLVYYVQFLFLYVFEVVVLSFWLRFLAHDTFFNYTINIRKFCQKFDNVRQ